jgi:galactokinase
MTTTSQGEARDLQIARQLRESFRRRFGEPAVICRAPGRVNLIGEHTDYNEGFVMPAAIGLHTWVAGAPRSDTRLLLRSENYSDEFEFDLRDSAPRPRRHWSDYARGVALGLARAGSRMGGANLLIRGEVPIGAGLSSSAALEVATGLALLHLAGEAIDRIGLARLCQQAENEFVGMRCGIMDQFIACLARAGHALLLDCRSLQCQLAPLPDCTRLVICNTMVRHELAGSEYNRRRAECEHAVNWFRRRLPHVRSLRDVTLADLEQHGKGMSSEAYRRARHVISENARVLAAASALERGELGVLGRLMAESHSSLRRDYEVSCPELDLMVELAAGQQGVYGARMTGGGFGGCTVNLVEHNHAPAFRQNIAQEYARRTGRQPDIYICSAAPGAEEVSVLGGEQ